MNTWTFLADGFFPLYINFINIYKPIRHVVFAWPSRYSGFPPAATLPIGSLAHHRGWGEAVVITLLHPSRRVWLEYDRGVCFGMVDQSYVASYFTSEWNRRVLRGRLMGITAPSTLSQRPFQQIDRALFLRRWHLEVHLSSGFWQEQGLLFSATWHVKVAQLSLNRSMWISWGIVQQEADCPRCSFPVSNVRSLARLIRVTSTPTCSWPSYWSDPVYWSVVTQRA